MHAMRWMLCGLVAGLASACVTPGAVGPGQVPQGPEVRGKVVSILERPGAGADKTSLYEVKVRLADGQTRTMTFAGLLPYSLGEEVALSGASIAATTTPGTAQPSNAQSGTSGDDTGQWVYTNPYGWVWAPTLGAYSYVPGYASSPYTSVYLTGRGWVWVSAPWLWSWQPGLSVSFGGGYPVYGVWGRSWGRSPRPGLPGRWGPSRVHRHHSSGGRGRR